MQVHLIQVQYADPWGLIVQRPCDPLERLEIIVVDGVLLRPLTHEPNRWRWYEGPVLANVDLDLLAPRCLWREPGERHPAHIDIAGIGRWTLRAPSLGAPSGIVRDQSGVRVGRGRGRHGGLPVSVSRPHRDTSQGSPTSEGGFNLLRYKDGGLSDMTGRPLIASKSDADREDKRAGTSTMDPRQVE